MGRRRARLGGARALKQKDYLNGGFGDDTIYSGRGTNTVYGGDGNDYLQGNGVSSQLFGGNGADTIRVAGKRTRIDGGPATTRSPRSPPAAAARVKCGPGNDTVIISRFKGNPKRVKVAEDCEKKKG